MNSNFLRPNFDFIQELLSHGEYMEVLEPQALRKEMSRIGKAIGKRNGGKGADN